MFTQLRRRLPLAVAVLRGHSVAYRVRVDGGLGPAAARFHMHIVECDLHGPVRPAPWTPPAVGTYDPDARYGVQVQGPNSGNHFTGNHFTGDHNA